MDNRIFGLDPQLLFDTAIGLIAMLVLFILLSYLLFNPARKLIQKRNVHNVMFQLQIIYYRLISRQPHGLIYMQQCMIGH